tara:strand:+ start:905 stop:2305 length:1401 start_codon:yes stop_codon:yes gene_type:complete
MKILNTLSKTKEEFKPLAGNTINMYTCGVTVYDHCHIGHGRSLYVFEVMRRYLKYKGFKVNFIRNITDIDDKIINRARTWADEQSISLQEAFDKVRNAYIDSYYDDLKRLCIPKADLEPKATENISDMIEYIGKLIAKEFAYEVSGSVYFSVRKVKDYGKLSGKKIDDLLESVRIDSDTAKKDPLDFALWKKAKEDEPNWDSPWGKGRPGWHIECSVMSQKYLKTQTLDIHGGGRDLVFPHHENEIAQSQSLTGKTFANYWIHHGLLTIDKQKMAKSLGNFITIKAVLDKYPADVLKVFYLQAHYSSSIDFSWERMEEAKKAYERIDILLGKVKQLPASEPKTKEILKLKSDFSESMDDDFNMPKGLAVLFDLVNLCNKAIDDDDRTLLSEGYFLLKQISDIFSLTFETKELEGISESEIENLVQLRIESKNKKDYIQADKIRKELEAKGIILEDTKDGTKWRRKL